MFEDLPILTVVIVLAVVAYLLLSFSYIGPTEVGLVNQAARATPRRWARDRVQA